MSFYISSTTVTSPNTPLLTSTLSQLISPAPTPFFFTNNLSSLFFRYEYLFLLFSIFYFYNISPLLSSFQGLLFLLHFITSFTPSMISFTHLSLYPIILLPLNDSSYTTFLSISLPSTPPLCPPSPRLPPPLS